MDIHGMNRGWSFMNLYSIILLLLLTEVDDCHKKLKVPLSDHDSKLQINMNLQ